MSRAELALSLTQDSIDQARKELRAALTTLRTDVERMIDHFDNGQEGLLTTYAISSQAMRVEHIAFRVSAARGQAGLLKMVLDEQKQKEGQG